MRAKRHPTQRRSRILSAWPLLCLVLSAWPLLCLVLVFDAGNYRCDEACANLPAPARRARADRKTQPEAPHQPSRSSNLAIWQSKSAISARQRAAPRPIKFCAWQVSQVSRNKQRREPSDPPSVTGSAIGMTGKDAGRDNRPVPSAPAGGRAAKPVPKGRERSGPRKHATGVAGGA
jgi:hypothetical protein